LRFIQNTKYWFNKKYIINYILFLSKKIKIVNDMSVISNEISLMFQFIYIILIISPKNIILKFDTILHDIFEIREIDHDIFDIREIAHF
jgi:hypothetical protein